MSVLLQGPLQKMVAQHKTPIEYALPVGQEQLPLNPLLGKTFALQFDNKITCVGCGRVTKKSFNQGYCYPCFISKAACDRCIMSPEHCHFAAGTCREPEWAQSHCNVDHFVYIANSSALKIGITRHTQIPTRWIDQGASQALAIFRVKTRHQSGLIEVLFKDHVADKTNWQRMLKGSPELRDLYADRDRLVPLLSEGLAGFVAKFGGSELLPVADASAVELSYPILEYPKKVVAQSLEKGESVGGTLLGIKGQYLIFDSGVVNVRKYTGYHVTVSS